MVVIGTGRVVVGSGGGGVGSTCVVGSGVVGVTVGSTYVVVGSGEVVVGSGGVGVTVVSTCVVGGSG